MTLFVSIIIIHNRINKIVKLLGGHLKVCAHTLTGLGRFFFSLCILYQAYDMLRTQSAQLDEEFELF